LANPTAQHITNALHSRHDESSNEHSQNYCWGGQARGAELFPPCKELSMVVISIYIYLRM
jgi:hypothetical protein